MGAQTNYTDTLIIRVGKACNFRCNFCNVSYNQKNIQLKESIRNIIAQFYYKLKFINMKSQKLIVTISGGEPSIFKKETIFILKYIQRYFSDKNIELSFEVQTNASNIDYHFAKQLKDHGVGLALVSFHTIDKKIFENTIGVNYSFFQKVVQGIKELHNAGIEVVTNSVLSRDNKENFLETIKFIESEFPFINFYNVGTIQPHGEALTNLEKVIPIFTDVERQYNAAIFYIKKKGREVLSHYVGPPACYIYSKKDSLEILNNTNFRKEFNFSERYLTNSINDKNKLQTNECEKCLYNNICSGIWNEYVGLQELKPVKYILDKNHTFEKNLFAYKIKDKNENLKKIYDANIRQVIIPTSIGEKQDIYDLLRQSTKLGFYKITLLVDSQFELEKDIVFTGVGNIQVHKGDISQNFVYYIQKFSKKYSPQFQINLDIFE